MIQMNEVSPGNYVVLLDESFDFEKHKEFRDAIKSALTGGAKTLAVDFAAVDYIDSSALGMLMLTRHETSEANCKLSLTNVQNGHARNVLQLVKFDEIFDIQYV